MNDLQLATGAPAATAQNPGHMEAFTFGEPSPVLDSRDVLDYLESWTARVQEVRVDDIRRAFARVLQPDRMVTVVVGAR